MVIKESQEIRRLKSKLVLEQRKFKKKSSQLAKLRRAKKK